MGYALKLSIWWTDANSLRKIYLHLGPWSWRSTWRDQGWMNTKRVWEELTLRIQNGGLTTQHDMEKICESFLIWPIFDQNFNFQIGKSFSFIKFHVCFFFSWFRSKSIRADLSWSDPNWQLELIRSDFCTCLLGRNRELHSFWVGESHTEVTWLVKQEPSRRLLGIVLSVLLLWHLLRIYIIFAQHYLDFFIEFKKLDKHLCSSLCCCKW